MGRYNRIDLKHSGHYEEYQAGGAITPGMRVQLDSDGDVTAQATQGGLGVLRVAQEDALQGYTVDNAYASGDVVFILEPKAGDITAVLLKDGEVIVKGDKLIADTDGTFIKTTGTPAQTDYEAEEALSPSGSNQLIKAKRI